MFSLALAVLLPLLASDDCDTRDAAQHALALAARFSEPPASVRDFRHHDPEVRRRVRQVLRDYRDSIAWDVGLLREVWWMTEIDVRHADRGVTGSVVYFDPDKLLLQAAEGRGVYDPRTKIFNIDVPYRVATNASLDYLRLLWDSGLSRAEIAEKIRAVNAKNDETRVRIQDQSSRRRTRH